MDKILLREAGVVDNTGDIIYLEALKNLHEDIKEKLPIEIPAEILGKEKTFSIVGSIIEDKKLYIYVEENKKR